MGKKNFKDVTDIKVDAPDARFQDDQATVAAIDGDTAKTESFVRQEKKTNGPALRQEKVAEVLTAGHGGDASGSTGVSGSSAFGLRDISFSGDTGTILGDASGTPRMAGDYQGKSRMDKRLSDLNKQIDFAASEQILTAYDNIPPLAASESTVGYNGNPKNAAARSQKKTGFTSAEMLFDRSVDFITHDEFVFSAGQVVKQHGVTYQDYPAVTLSAQEEEVAFEQTRGNYSPREVVIKVKKDGGRTFVSGFEVLEDDFSCNDESDAVVNVAATNHRIDMNRAELTRQTIDADAGSPTSPHYNPLGRSCGPAGETDIVAYLQDLENVMGSEVLASYRFFNKARGHFLNRVAKDGQSLVDPGIDALYGGVYNAPDMETLAAALSEDASDGDQPFFRAKGMANGSAAIMISIFDSPRKYNTKGDIVNQPRGLKLHAQTAANNLAPFRAKNEFISALNAIDVYSTIDYEYDPMLPVCITDNVRLVHPYSWAKALKFTRSAPGVRTYQSNPLRYIYNAGAGMNSYFVTIGDPVLNGVAYFAELHSDKIYDALKATASGGEVTWRIPVVHSTTHFSLWDILVCASTPYIIYERTNALKDILDYEMFYRYPFQGNVSIQDNCLSAVNYSIPEPGAQLVVRKMNPSTAIRWKYPELFINCDGGTMAPFYFNEREYSPTGSIDVPKLEYQYTAEFTTPVVRSGIKLGGLDDFFAMEVKDQLLITDRMMRLPNNEDMADVNGWIYKYDQQSDGIVMLDDAYTSVAKLSHVYATPRLLGWYMPAFAGSCSPRLSDVHEEFDEDEDGSFVLSKRTTTAARTGLAAADSAFILTAAPSYQATMYKGVYGESKIVTRSLDVGAVNVSRAQAFQQIWAKKQAGNYSASKYFDLPLALNEGFVYKSENNDGKPAWIEAVPECSYFSPFTYNKYALDRNNNPTNTAYSETDLDKRPILLSIHRVVWPTLQRLPFVLNPFERSTDLTPAVDPWSMAYCFGLAGFMSANFDEETYNRMMAFQNLGFGYTSDPMTAASPVFKSGATVASF